MHCHIFSKKLYFPQKIRPLPHHIHIIFIVRAMQHLLLQIFDKQAADRVQNSEDHDAHICKNRQIHIGNANSP